MRRMTMAVGSAVGALVLLVGAAAAGAQDGTGVKGRAEGGSNAGSPLPGGGTTRDLTVPGQGGVAGTGLGGSTDGSGDGATAGRPGRDGIPGTGGSVKGPAGQGIGGQGISGGGAGIAGAGAGGAAPGR